MWPQYILPTLWGHSTSCPPCGATVHPTHFVVTVHPAQLVCVATVHPAHLVCVARVHPALLVWHSKSFLLAGYTLLVHDVCDTSPGVFRLGLVLVVILHGVVQVERRSLISPINFSVRMCALCFLINSGNFVPSMWESQLLSRTV